MDVARCSLHIERFFLEILHGGHLGIGGLVFVGMTGGGGEGGEPLATILHTTTVAVGKFLAQRLQHLFLVTYDDAAQVLERVFHTARTADAPRYGIGGSTQEMAQTLADDGVANVEDEVGTLNVER